VLVNVGLALLGSDGTMKSGTGGVYVSPTFYEGVLMSKVRDDTEAIARGISFGRIRPWCVFNYADQVDPIPVVELPLPDPERDARTKAYGDRLLQLHAIIKVETDNKCSPNQDRINALAKRLDVDPPTLAAASDAPVARLDLAPTDIAKVVRVDEARRSRDLPPIGDERGALTIGELDAQAKADAAEPASAEETA
jgi:hypothetical protein